jgi:pSer/pThr/pTyr-binding forkhead associated (FHA) protein
METTVTLIVTRGPLAGRKFPFVGPTSCLIGRSRDCTIALPLEVEHLDVSRRHCLLDISPIALRIRDLGSLNGTFVNGKNIGQRGRHDASTEGEGPSCPSVELRDGDEIQLGEHTAFRVCFAAARPRDAARKHRPSSGELRFEERPHP